MQSLGEEWGSGCHRDNLKKKRVTSSIEKIASVVKRVLLIPVMFGHALDV